MPQRPSPRSVVPPAPREPELKPGDLICPNCGAGNDAARRFCRRCGHSLMTAVIAVRPPWYRRIFARQRALAAGQRPDYMGRRSRGSRSVRGLITVLVLLGLVGAVASYFVVPEVRERVGSLVADGQRMWQTFRHPGEQALDDDIATYWLADPSDGTPTISVNFDDTLDLAASVFHSGAASGDDFARYRRPRTVEFSYPGGNRPIRIVLTDEPSAQEHDLDIPGVRTLELRIIDFYDTGGEVDILVALREVEFIAR